MSSLGCYGHLNFSRGGSISGSYPFFNCLCRIKNCAVAPATADDTLNLGMLAGSDEHEKLSLAGVFTGDLSYLINVGACTVKNCEISRFLFAGLECFKIFCDLSVSTDDNGDLFAIPCSFANCGDIRLRKLANALCLQLCNVAVVMDKSAKGIYFCIVSLFLCHFFSNVCCSFYAKAKSCMICNSNLCHQFFSSRLSPMVQIRSNIISAAFLYSSLPPFSKPSAV